MVRVTRTSYVSTQCTSARLGDTYRRKSTSSTSYRSAFCVTTFKSQRLSVSVCSRSFSSDSYLCPSPLPHPSEERRCVFTEVPILRSTGVETLFRESGNFVKRLSLLVTTTGGTYFVSPDDPSGFYFRTAIHKEMDIDEEWEFSSPFHLDNSLVHLPLRPPPGTNFVIFSRRPF